MKEFLAKTEKAKCLPFPFSFFFFQIAFFPSKQFTLSNKSDQVAVRGISFPSLSFSLMSLHFLPKYVWKLHFLFCEAWTKMKGGRSGRRCGCGEGGGVGRGVCGGGRGIRLQRARGPGRVTHRSPHSPASGFLPWWERSQEAQKPFGGWSQAPNPSI